MNPRSVTPQFRTLLIRKLKNLYPDQNMEITKQDDKGIEFQLLSNSGVPVTGRIGIYRSCKDTLTKSNLERLIERNLNASYRKIP